MNITDTYSLRMTNLNFNVPKAVVIPAHNVTLIEKLIVTKHEQIPQLSRSHTVQLWQIGGSSVGVIGCVISVCLLIGLGTFLYKRHKRTGGVQTVIVPTTEALQSGNGEETRQAITRLYPKVSTDVISFT